MPKQIQLFYVDFWVQAHDLLIGFYDFDCGTTIIGTFLDYDVNNDAGLWRAYMRIRVRMDVRLP